MEILPTAENKGSNLESLVLKRNFAVYDGEFFRALKEMPWNQWFRESENPLRCREKYLETISNWIFSTKLNRISGLDRFQRRDLINGTTQSFDDAYFRHRGRRLRIFRGEYAYHRRAFLNHCFLDDEPLREGDFVIASLPFCSTGDVHPDFYGMLDRALAVNAPVVVDCAYFGTCLEIPFDFSHPIIESVSFSLTKGLGLGDIRSGVRFSNLNDSSPICQQNDFNHTVLAAARVGIYMMEKFSSDHIPMKYREAQLSVCRDLNVRASRCMHLATGDEKWNEFRIDDKFNTLGIRQLVKMRQLKKI